MAVVSVEELQCPPVGQQPLEIVERKGLGHPDSICDGVMEHARRAFTLVIEHPAGYQAQRG